MGENYSEAGLKMAVEVKMEMQSLLQDQGAISSMLVDHALLLMAHKMKRVVSSPMHSASSGGAFQGSPELAAIKSA